MYQALWVTWLCKSLQDDDKNLPAEYQSVLEAPLTEYSMNFSKFPLFDLISILI